MKRLLRPPFSFCDTWEAAKLLLGVALLFSFCGMQGTAFAQDGPTVSGTVTDGTTGESLPGVNIRVVGTQIGTTTDADGTYEVTVPGDNSTLQYTFVGYQEQTVDVNGRTSIDVTLEPATLTGEEVVVVGYSEQRRADLTGSVDVADVGDMQQLSTAQVTEQLQGQLAGVSVKTSGQPGDEPQINIRGFNTFGNNQPLFVVDGVPTQDISFLNSQDIESLQVLKDAGAASQYGARASNGVVVITTNQGGGEDISVDYNASVGYQVPQSGNVYNALSPQEQGELEWRAQRNSNPNQDPSHPIWGDGDQPDVPEWILPARASDPNTDNYFVQPEYTDPSALGDFNYYIRSNPDGTNWFDEISDPAMQTSHNVSVGGGGDLGNYYTSIGYTNRQGTVTNTSFERYTIRANTEFNVTDNLRIGENLTFTVSENLQTGTLQEGQALGMAYRQHTIIPVRDIQGNFAGTIAPGLGNAKNPVAFRERARTDDDEDRRLFGNAFVEFDFLDDFTARSSFGADISSGYFKFFSYPEYENSENVTTNAYNEQVYNNRSWTWSNQVNYNGTLGDSHNLSVMAAAEAVQNVGRFDQVGRQGYFSFNPDFTQLATGSGTPTISSSDRSVNSLLSFIGNVDYDYNGTYLLSLTVRRDGSSKFLENQWGTFPSATAGVRVSDFGPLQNIGWLTDLKIRGGYGVMGNQLNVDPNNAYTLYGGTIQNSYYPIDGAHNDAQQGFRRVRIGNPEAQWEQNEDINVGVDFAILNGQLEGTVDFYQKNIEDLLFNPALPATAGAGEAPDRNVASMRNRGIDVSLRGSQSFSDDAELSGRLTLTTYNNEIQSIAQGVEQFGLDFRRFGVPIIRNEVGHPISSFYGYKVEGFWQNQDEIDQANQEASDGEYMQDAAPGRFRYADTNDDGEITTEDRVHLGNPHADFSYGLNLNFTYSNIDLSMQLYGEQGKEIWNQTKWWTDFRGSFNGMKSETALHDSWQEEGDTDVSAPIQETGYFGFATGGVPNSYFVEDGSYLRIRSLQLGYTLPSSLVGTIGIQRLRIYAQSENVLTLTGYSGLDPDIGATQSAENSGGAGTTNFGIDGGSYPTPRTFTMGVNLSF